MQMQHHRAAVSHRHPQERRQAGARGVPRRLALQDYGMTLAGNSQDWIGSQPHLRRGQAQAVLRTLHLQGGFSRDHVGIEAKPCSEFRAEVPLILNPCGHGQAGKAPLCHRD